MRTTRAKPAPQWTPASIQRLWDERAGPCDSHSFLERNEIPPSQYVKALDDWLVIPLYAGSKHPGNLLLIDPEGQARFLPGCEIRRSYFVFGSAAAVKRTNTIYLVDGWPNAWTIHKVTGSLVIGPAKRSEFIPVAQFFRRWFPEAKLVVCAVNERWSYFERGGWEIPNPAMNLATRVAERVNGRLAFPDFVDLGGKPTGFNDLRLREGPRAVAASLDPKDLRTLLARFRLQGHDVLDWVYEAELSGTVDIGRNLGDVLTRVVRGLSAQADRPPEGYKAAIQVLRHAGLLVKGKRVFLSNGGSSLNALLEKRWPNRRWMSLVRELPGVRPTAKAKYFNPNLISRATSIPVSLLQLW
ncbi:MAG: hypothetical protein F4Z31_07070 [Gemmatimonadetes bacterium]|nr:hypothetical protein [Gemmatimonadota bacterium]MYE94065.1 hypothetical protein [Gemmatimonadota bacterium]MYJ12158.1 hypothetical protein [Gemmatimonadota bacterium]